MGTTTAARQRFWDDERVKGVALILFLIQVIPLLVLLIMAYVSPNVREEDGLGRQLGREVILLGGSAPVSLAFDTDTLPVCPPRTEKVNLVVLMDSSGSMEGIPYADSLEAARRFVEVADLNAIHTAIIQFSDGPELATTFLNDRQKLLDVIDHQLIFVGGTTDLAAAVRAAADLLNSSDAPINDRDVILLFTDGGSEKDPALQAADAFKAAGGRILTIGLEGIDFNAELLEQMASSADDSLLTPDSSQLSALFATAAGQIVESKPSEISLSETYDPERFEVEPGTGQILRDGEINWVYVQEAPANAAPQSITASYLVTPRKIGWLPVSDTGATLSAVVCDQAINIQNTRADPNLLVLPPLGILIFMAIETLLLGLLAFWPRPPKPIVYPEPLPSPDFKQPSIDPGWVKGSGPIAPISPPPQFNPTLILGLGPTGHLALQEIRKNLLDVGQGQMPRGLKLLWIGMDPVNDGEDCLPDTERHLIQPQYNDIVMHDLGPGSNTFDWWQHTLGQGADSRAHHRMAFFWDILFEHKNRLHNVLSYVQSGFQQDGVNDFQVFIVSAPGEADSAMLIDLTTWIHRSIPDRASRFIPWLIMSQIGADESAETRANRYAALREISRYMLNRNQLVETGDGGYAMEDDFLFDGVMIFDEEPGHPGDIKATVAALADQMVGLLGKRMSTDFFNDLVAQMGMHDAAQNEALFISSYGHTFYWPIEPVRRVCEAQMVRDLLFSEGNADLPPGMFARLDLTEEQQVQLALDFLRQPEPLLENDRFPFRELADAVDPSTAWQPGPTHHLPSNLTAGFTWKLMLWLNRWMNDAGAAGLQGRSGSLGRAEALLNGLEIVLQRARGSLPSAGVPGKEKLATELLGAIKGLDDVVGQFKAQVQEWVKLHRSAPTANQPIIPPIRKNITTRTDVAVSLKSRLDETLSANTRVLSEVLDASTCRTIVLPLELDPVRDVNPPASTVISYYYPRLVHASNELPALARLAQRVGWFWDLDDRSHPYLRLHVLPSDYNPETTLWSSTRFGADRGEDIYQALMRLAPRMTEGLLLHQNAASLLNGREEEFLSPLRTAQPLINYKNINVQNFFTRSAFITSKNTAAVGGWASRLPDTRFKMVQSDTDSRIIALWIVYKMPFSSITKIQNDQVAYQPARTLHVHLAEQQATELDEDFRTSGTRESVSPVTARLLAYPGLFQWAAYAYLFGWLFRERDETDRELWFLRLPDGGEINLYDPAARRPASLEDAVENFCLVIPLRSSNTAHALHASRVRTTLERFQKNLETERQRPYSERDALFKACEQTDIPSLSASRSPVERDLAAYLISLIAHERLK